MLSADTFSALSFAVTVKLYAFLTISPVTVYVVPVVVPTCVVPLYISYPVTSTSSVDAVHDNLTLVSVCDVIVKLLGAVGTCISVAFVVTDKSSLAGDTFPAASLAITVKLYAVLPVSPVTV